MGIFTLRNYLNEAEINGQPQDTEEDDFSAGADEDPDTTDNTDTASESETPADDGGDDDFTVGADDDVDTGDDSSGDSDTSTDTETPADDGGDDDFTVGADDDVDTGDDSSGDSDTEDFTDGAEGDTTDGGDTSSGDSGTEDSGGSTDSDTSEDSTDTNDSDNLKQIEAELFSNLTPEQLAIKNTELKSRFIEVYTTIGSILIRINDVPKSEDNIETLKFVTDKLLELRDLVDHNITTSFQTRTYTENNIIYQQCLAVLDAINSIISSIPSHNKDDKENEDEGNSLEDVENKDPEEKLDISDSSMTSAQESASIFDFNL